MSEDKTPIDSEVLALRAENANLKAKVVSLEAALANETARAERLQKELNEYPQW